MKFSHDAQRDFRRKRIKKFAEKQFFENRSGDYDHRDKL